MTDKYRIAFFAFVFMAAICTGFTAKSDSKSLYQTSFTVPQGLGVNIHTHASFPPTLKPVKNAGFALVRTNIYWNHIEKEKGKYEWREYDKLLLEMKKQGIRPLLVLSFSNPLYEPSQEIRGLEGKTVRKTQAPASNESINAYANYAAAAAERYKEYNVIWEIWNEPDYKMFWLPKPDAAGYDKLAHKTCKAIKAADPAATIIGPSASGTPSDPDKTAWWAGFLKGKAIECLDAISLHPYVHNTNKGPEINIEKYQTLKRLLSEHTNRKLPLINSELGFSTSDWNVSRERQGALLVRNYMVNILSGVGISVWYDWFDDGTDAKNREHNFGVITRKHAKKPLYFAAQTLSSTLNGYSFQFRIDTDGTPVKDPLSVSDPYLLLFKHSERPPVIVAWQADKHPRDYTISMRHLEKKPIKITDYVGGTVPTTLKDQRLHITLNEYPVYISASVPEDQAP